MDGRIKLLIGAIGTAFALFSSTPARAESKDLVPPTQLDAEPAPYPEGAHGDAVVVLELEIGKDGAVTDVKVTAGEAPFADVARTAALSWKFAPATRCGIPIRARISAKVTFHEPPPPPKPPRRADA